MKRKVKRERTETEEIRKERNEKINIKEEGMEPRSKTNKEKKLEKKR